MNNAFRHVRVKSYRINSERVNVQVLKIHPFTLLHWSGTKKSAFFKPTFMFDIDKVLFYHNIDNLVGHNNDFCNRFSFNPFVGMSVCKDGLFDVAVWQIDGQCNLKPCFSIK